MQVNNDKNSVRFLHLSDTHFGVHFALHPKNLNRRAYGELFFQKVNDLINKSISRHQVDFIIHSGDFFNRSNPPPEIVDRGVQSFQLATREGIPIFVLPGNHERSKLPFGLLPFSDNINLFSKPCSFFFKKNGISIKLMGFPYIRENIKRKFKTLIKKASQKSSGDFAKKADYQILVIHQLIEGSCIENFIFRRGANIVSFLQIPKKFHYIACGHVHRFQLLYKTRLNPTQSTSKFFLAEQKDNHQSWYFSDENGLNSSVFQNPLIIYPGSVERVSFAERNEPKGYIIGHLRFPDNEIQNNTYEFHQLPAVNMMYLIWDLSITDLDENINQTLEKMYKAHLRSSPLHDKKENSLTAIFRIKIKSRSYPSPEKLKYLRLEAKRLNIYLTFSLAIKLAQAR
ncbi:MAG: exonuclease SbcCD subunit D [Promethearchaeota archaeon]